MKIKLTVFSLLFVIAFSCCISKSEQKQVNMDNLKKAQIKRVNIKYLNSRSFYKEDFVDHFPSALDDNYITYTESVTPEAGLVHLFLITKLKKDYLVKAQRTAVAKYISSDSCLFVVNRFASTENYSYNITLSENDKKVINLPCYQDLYPIPNFWDSPYSCNTTECKLLEGFDVYVFDAKPGKFIKDSLLTDGRYMPEKWKNGYSKGVAISEKRNVIIYWVLIW